MRNSWNLNEAASRIRAAGLCPAEWPAALDFLAETVGGTGAVVFGTDGHVAHAPSSSSLDQPMAEYAEGGWYERDSRREGVGRMLTTGIITDRDLHEGSFRSDFYRDFLPRHKCQWFSGVGFKTGDDLWCLSIQRSAAGGPFQGDEVERLGALWRPLSDSATLTRVFADQHALSTMDALELVRHAAIVCDPKGNIVASNDTARALLGLLYRSKRKTLTFAHGASAEAYDRLLRTAVRSGLSASVAPLSATLLDNTGRSLIVRAISLVERDEFVFYPARVLLLFKLDPLDLGARMRRYRLTPAELAIIEELRCGNGVAGIAIKNKVKEDTVRTQLKSIFSKTDVHSQSQLVALTYRSDD